MQKDLFCTPIVPLLQCKKGFFAHLKLYFGSAKKPFCVIYRVSDTVETIKIDPGNLYNRFLFCNSFLLRVQYLHIKIVSPSHRHNNRIIAPST